MTPARISLGFCLYLYRDAPSPVCLRRISRSTAPLSWRLLSLFPSFSIFYFLAQLSSLAFVIAYGIRWLLAFGFWLSAFGPKRADGWTGCCILGWGLSGQSHRLGERPWDRYRFLWARPLLHGPDQSVFQLLALVFSPDPSFIHNQGSAENQQ